jgi:hypothetical protein
MERTGFFSGYIGEPGTREGYWKRSLGHFYSEYTHRLLCYLLLGVTYIITTFVSITIFYGPQWLSTHLAFASAYAIHAALLYGGCYAAVDFLANRLGPETYKYHGRTVARQWLVMFIGFVLAYALHRSTYYLVLDSYAHWVVRYFQEHPDQRRGMAVEFIWFFSSWAIKPFIIIQFSLHCQKAKGPAPSKEQSSKKSEPSSNNEAGVSTLVHQAEGKATKIDQAKIAYVSVEDHYCRIHFLNGHDVSHVLQRLTLNQLQAEFDGVGFVKIHRSHLVNLDHVLGWKIEKRKHYMVMEHGVELPISRSRMADLKPILNRRKLPKLS